MLDTIIIWDELTEETQTLDGSRYGLTMQSGDEEIIAACRKIYCDGEEEEAGGWMPKAIIRGAATIIIEWRSDRDHLATTLLIASG